MNDKRLCTFCNDHLEQGYDGFEEGMCEVCFYYYKEEEED